jgi:arylsulfatase A-like enzyme
MMERQSRGLSRWQVPAAVLALTVVCFGSACSGPAPDELTTDFAAAWADGLLVTEPAELDIGTAGARRSLGEGWYYDERNRDSGETFVWSRGPRSEIFFHLGWRRNLGVEITCRPFQFDGATPQILRFELNKHSIGNPLELQPSNGRYSINLPASAQVLGRNRLVVRYARVDAPSSVSAGSTDQRALGVAWTRLRFEGVDPGPLQVEDGVVLMPAGSRAEHFPDLRLGSTLTIESCESVGESPSVLEVSVLGEFDAEPEFFSTDCDGREVEIPLTNRHGLSRIGFAAYPQDDVGIPSGIRLHHPRIDSPRAEAAVIEATVVPTSGQAERPNVIIYLVDALRSDRLGVYGCERPLSPRLDAFAAEGMTFTDMVAQSSWTKAAVASVFTGLWPRAHGVNGPDDQLPESLPTLPEIFQAAGYQTGAVVANAYVGRPFGFARGFDYFEFIEHHRGRSEVVGDRIEQLLDARRDTARPFFLYIHTIDPHAPYAPPAPFLETFASAVEDPTVGQVETVRGLVLGTVEPSAGLGHDLRQLYDAEVAANDASFGRLIDRLEALGELDNTVVVFTSDHGEAFGEHDSWTHGLDLYNEVLSVPLVVRLPGGAGAGQSVGTTVQHIDLMPTLLDLCAIDAPEGLPGAVLFDTSGAIKVGPDRTVFAYLDYWGKTGATAIRDGWKLIEPLSADFGSEIELYRHDEDRTEVRDLAVPSPVRSGWLLAQLRVALKGAGVSLTTEVDPETRAQLEALGYMH